MRKWKLQRLKSLVLHHTVSNYQSLNTGLSKSKAHWPAFYHIIPFIYTHLIALKTALIFWNLGQAVLRPSWRKGRNHAVSIQWQWWWVNGSPHFRCWSKQVLLSMLFLSGRENIVYWLWEPVRQQAPDEVIPYVFSFNLHTDLWGRCFLPLFYWREDRTQRAK